jgi:N-acetylglucosamine-6-sulfatase
LVGKYLNGYSGKGIPAGWDSWVGNYSGYMNHDGKVRFHGRPAETVADGRHHTDVVAEEAERFLREMSEAGGADEPFFLYMADLAPHDPNLPAARHAGEMDGAPLDRPPS